jgi:hypothetical protein
MRMVSIFQQKIHEAIEFRIIMTIRNAFWLDYEQTLE